MASASLRLVKASGCTPSTALSRTPSSCTLTITAVALLDNQHALSGSNDHAIKLFNVNDGAVLRTFTHLRGVGRCLALLPDGLRFVSSSGNHAARIAYHGLAP